MLGNGLKRKEKWMMARVFSLSWFPVLSVNLFVSVNGWNFAQFDSFYFSIFSSPLRVCHYTWFVHFCLHPVCSCVIYFVIDLWMVQGVFCLSTLWSIRGLICRSVSSVNVLTCGESRWVNDTIFLSEISVGLGFDDETRKLSPSRNRRPDSNGTPEEEQPITIIAPASDYLSVI